MSGLIQELYETRSYPAMSHPLSDPAVSAVAAGLGGLAVAHPAAARILEIGCGSGFNLIPLALRWPGSELTGIDLSGPAVASARELARAAGVSNIVFHALDLRDFAPAGEGFDFIIAHGFLSWVPDEVKAALFAFCRRHLAPAGMATISFNLECGWRPRLPVVAKARAIQQAGAVDEMAALAILRSVTAADSPELPIIDDMLAKGPEILAFDDFGPVNDPWSLERFVGAAAGLRWLGESHPADNHPSGMDLQALAELQRRHAADPLALQHAADVASGRTFRSAVLCRAEAQLEARVPLERLLEWAVRPGPHWPAAPAGPVFQVIARHAPECLALKEIMGELAAGDRRDGARQVQEAIQRGWLEARIEPVRFDVNPPARPALNGFRLECARRGLPLVDLWHQPCAFPAAHYPVLAAMDGTLDQPALAAFARRHCPELAFAPWLRHLAGRGMFA